MKIRKIFGKIARILGIHGILLKIHFHFMHKRMQRQIRKHGVAAIERIDQVSEAIGVPIFLTFGALLGAIREHDFISYDLDIDFGMMAAQRPDHFVEVMEQHGFRLFERAVVQHDGDEARHITEESYRFHGIRIDIFHIYEQERGYAVYCYSPQDYALPPEEQARLGFPARRYWLTPSTFERTDFLGKRVWLPAAAHQWSAEVYGSSYMTPIKNWDAKEHKTTVEFNAGKIFREISR